MIGSPILRDFKQEKSSNLKVSPKETVDSIQRISDLNIDIDSQSKNLKERKSSIKPIVTSTLLSRRSEYHPVFSAPENSSIVLPKRIENILSEAKFNIEDIYYSSEGLWAFKKKVSEFFDDLTKSLTEEFILIAPKDKAMSEKTQATTSEVNLSIRELGKSRESVNSLQKNTPKNFPAASEYERKLLNLSQDLEFEKTKNSDLSFKLSKIETERDGLIKLNSNFISTLKSKKNDSEGIHEVLKENEELKKNIELIIHNYDNLNEKMKLQRKDFQMYRDQIDDSNIFDHVKLKDLFIDLYFKIFSEEENKSRINSQFPINPKIFFDEVLNKFNQIEEKHDANIILLEKLQEENKTLQSKISGDQRFSIKLEKELKSHVSNEVSLAKGEILRQKEKKRNLKQNLNEISNNFQLKSLENQSLAEELLLAQSAATRFSEEIKEKTREIQVMSQQSSVKSNQILEFKRIIWEKDQELQELRANIAKTNNSEIEKKYLSSKQFIDKLQSQMSYLKKQIELADDKIHQLEYNLKLKEAEIKGVESKLSFQLSITDRLNDSLNANKYDLMKKFQEKLDEKESILQEGKRLNESLSNRLEVYSKAIQDYEQKSKDSEISEVLAREINESKLLLQSLITKISAKTGESFLDFSGNLKDYVRIIDSLAIVLMSQLDSSNTQMKLALSETGKLHEDLHKNELTIRELSLKSANYESILKSTETDKLFLKEKYSSRKNSLVTVENQIKEKELIHLQSLQILRDKFSSKKDKLKEKIRAKEGELNELKKKIEEGGVKSEAFILVQEREKALRFQVDELNLKTSNLMDEIMKLKKQRDEDERTMSKQSKNIAKFEQAKEEWTKSDANLKSQLEDVVRESEEKIRELQENLSLSQLKKQEHDDDSLQEDSDEYGEQHVSKLFKQIQEKEAIIKKANKRIMELQWAHRDVIDQCKENEEKFLAQLEIQEKITEENDQLNTQIRSLSEKLTEHHKNEEDLREKIKQLRESELVLKKRDSSLNEIIEEFKLKCADYEDEISGLQLEVYEFQSILKNYANDNSSLSVLNRTQNDHIKKLRDEIEELIKEKQHIITSLSRARQDLAARETFFDIERENFENLKDVLEKEKFNLEKQLSILQGQHEQDDEQIKVLSVEMEKLGEHRKSLRRNNSESPEKVDMIEKLMDQLEEKNMDILEHQGLISELQKENDDLRNDCSIKELTFNESQLKTSQEVIALKSEVKNLKSENKKLEASVEELRKGLEKIKSDVYDKEESIKILEEEKQLMNSFMRGKLQGDNLDQLLKVRQHMEEMIDQNKSLEIQLADTKKYYEEIVDNMKTVLDMFNKNKSSSNKSMWTHVDKLNKQIEERTRIILDLEGQVPRRNS